MNRLNTYYLNINRFYFNQLNKYYVNPFMPTVATVGINWLISVRLVEIGFQSMGYTLCERRKNCHEEKTVKNCYDNEKRIVSKISKISIQNLNYTNRRLIKIVLKFHGPIFNSFREISHQRASRFGPSRFIDFKD